MWQVLPSLMVVLSGMRILTGRDMNGRIIQSMGRIRMLVVTMYHMGIWMEMVTMI